MGGGGGAWLIPLQGNTAFCSDGADGHWTDGPYNSASGEAIQ